MARLQGQHTYATAQAFLDQHILQSMQELSPFPLDSNGQAEWFFSLNTIACETIPREMVRALCRDLTDRGLCLFRRGLFDEDGMPAGSGYGITAKGLGYLHSLQAHNSNQDIQ